MEARLGDRAARSGRISVDYAILQLAINFVEALGRDLCRCCVVVQPSCTKTAEKGEKGRTAKNKGGRRGR
ncbi:hypothetical protein GJ744_005891 [Endocarpon pusillum]|uniref:Uncharacterized protein n=1 Tax=Endocarpon pusillum TaxID=364733 RepID=A0A8H7E8I6_9EURO|nr:hypothetical protein GJ744_005891 [Endocarpon pusillum]